MVMPNVDLAAGIAAPRRYSMQSTGCTDDLSLIRQVQRGNHAAFEKLVYADDQGVLRLALRITGSQSMLRTSIKKHSSGRLRDSPVSGASAPFRHGSTELLPTCA